MSDTNQATKEETPFMESSDIFNNIMKAFVSPFVNVKPRIPTKPTAPELVAEKAALPVPRPQELLPAPRNAAPITASPERVRHWVDNMRIDRVFCITSYTNSRMVRLRLNDPHVYQDLLFLNEREVDEMIATLQIAKGRAFGRLPTIIT